MFKKYILLLIGTMLVTVLFVPSCDLEEEILDEITDPIVQADPNLLPNILAVPLAQVRKYWYRERIWGLMESTTDEAFFPTRGNDWEDGFVWQENYTHTWRLTHRDVVATWNDLNSSISAANTAILNLGEPMEDDADFLTIYRAQAVFLRSFFEYYLYDLYRKYPSRDPFDLDFLKAPTINEGDAGFYRLVSNLKSVLPHMKDRYYDAAVGDDDYFLKAEYGEPDKYTGLMLLAKLYLNKEVYTGVAGYDSCLIYLNQLIDNSSFALANDYFAMFDVNNNTRFNTADDEGIFVAVLSDAANFGLDNTVVWVSHTFHYVQRLGGNYTNQWNGVSAPESYLQSTWIEGTDTATDVRWNDTRYFDIFAVDLGFNYGQQYNVEGDSLFDRNGNPLNFTFACNYNDATEYEGVRVLKFAPRPRVENQQRTENDYPIWRYADALLMKAECLVRAESDVAGAEAIVNEIRTKRNAPAISALGVEDMLEKVYIERGLELYWEGHRRQDMIRFGTFLLPKTSKPETSPERAILLPIPQAAIDGTPGGVLTQNPGY
jgi:hypothetical protein